LGETLDIYDIYSNPIDHGVESNWR
jgi:hypothetical protein